MHADNEIVIPKDMIIVSETDEKGNIIFANDDFCKIAGYDISELLGNPHNIVRHQDMPKLAFEDLWKTIKMEMFGKVLLKTRQKMEAFIGFELLFILHKILQGNQDIYQLE